MGKGIKPLAKLPPISGVEMLFDERPLAFGAFRLRARSVEVIDGERPNLDHWTGALEFACHAYASSPFWIGDLVAYAESREHWREKLSQAMALTGLAEQTLHNLGHISRRVKEQQRMVAQSVAHAAVVAAMPAEDQGEWLERSQTEGWTVRELQQNVKASRRRAIIDGQAALEGMYRVFYADPPWLYGDHQPSGSGADSHYSGMTIDDLCKLPVEAHAHPNAVLFMWVTAPMLYEAPGPREVIKAWGFTPKTQRIWNKVRHNFGHYYSVQHELLIVATRGSCLPDRPTPMLDSIFTERPSDVHSEKPHGIRLDIEKQWDGPYVELFGRAPVVGWHVFGNDARLWAQQAADQDAEAEGAINGRHQGGVA
jgi:N6-adenosine-specific RNA methylase IME4